MDYVKIVVFVNTISSTQAFLNHNVFHDFWNSAVQYFHKFQQAPIENSVFSCLVCINFKSYKAFIIST